MSAEGSQSFDSMEMTIVNFYRCLYRCVRFPHYSKKCGEASCMRVVLSHYQMINQSSEFNCERTGNSLEWVGDHVTRREGFL